MSTGPNIEPSRTPMILLEISTSLVNPKIAVEIDLDERMGANLN